MLFGLTHAQWATQSGLTANAYGITDHAHKALFDLTSVNGSINDMMFTYLSVTKGLSGALSDMVFAWDGTFGAISGDVLLLETGDILLLETGDQLLLEA
jgi:hypothetical protein